MFKDRYILDLKEGAGGGCQAGGKEEATEDALVSEEGQRRSEGLPATPTQHQQAAGRHYQGRGPVGEVAVAV